MIFVLKHLTTTQKHTLLSWKSKTQGHILLSINSKLFRQLKERIAWVDSDLLRDSVEVLKMRKKRAIFPHQYHLGGISQVSQTGSWGRYDNTVRQGDFIKFLQEQRLLSYSVSKGMWEMDISTQPPYHKPQRTGRCAGIRDGYSHRGPLSLIPPNWNKQTKTTTPRGWE